MITYTPDPIAHPNSSFGFSYTEVRDIYRELVLLTDNEFKTQIAKVLRTAMFISYLKERDTDSVLNDMGLIHLIAHQIHLSNHEDSVAFFPLLREKFEKECNLV